MNEVEILERKLFLKDQAIQLLVEEIEELKKPADRKLDHQEKLMAR